MSGERERWREAAEALRRRGYLRRRGVPAARPAADVLELAAAAALLAVGATLGGSTGGGAALAAAAGLLLPWAALGVTAVALVVEELSDRAHRLGLPAARAVSGAGLVAGAAVALGWAAAVRGVPVPPAGVRLAGAVAAAVGGVALAVRVTARRVALRALARSPRSLLALPRLAWLAAAGAAVVVAAAAVGPPARRPETAPPVRLAVAPSAARVAVLAVDGLGRDDLEVLSPQGPARWGWASLGGSIPTSLPVAWVTAATGADPRAHGVVSVDQVRIAPLAADLLAAPALHRALLLWRPLGVTRERAVPAAQRRLPAVWEMAARAGVTVRVAGWWGSFPPRRVTGLVASERWLLAGEASAATVAPFPPPEPLPEGGTRPLDMDRRAAAVALAADPGRDRLVMAYFPGWWLEARRARGGPLAVARRLKPHGEIVVGAARELEARGWSVWLVSLEGGGGWVAASAAPAGRHPPVRLLALAPTWLDALGLPVPEGGMAPRRDLSGVQGRHAARATYGPPPPLVGRETREGTAQLELLRTLGYLE